MGVRPGKIISGAQTGADIGGLRAGKALGVPTGGWMARGFKTERGPTPWVAGMYGIREHSSDQYKPRTFANLMEADATVIFGSLASPGTWLTYTTCARASKPIIVNPEPAHLATFVHNATQWLGRPISLNIAGNRESINPGIEAWTFAVIVRAFDDVGAIATPLDPQRMPMLSDAKRRPIVIRPELRAFLHHLVTAPPLEAR